MGQLTYKHDKIKTKNKKLRILILYWGRCGGGPNYTLELAKAIAKYPLFELHLSLSRQSEKYRDFQSIPVVGRFDIATYSSVWSLIFRSLFLQVLSFRFSKYLLENKIDVVFCTMDHLWTSFMGKAIEKSKALYLLTIHDAIRHPGEKNFIRNWLLHRDINQSKSVFVLSKNVRDVLISKYNYPKENVYLSLHGVFPHATRNHGRKFPCKRPFRLLFFGRILPYKGLHILLQALSIIQLDFPNLELEIWGHGNLKPYKKEINQGRNIFVTNRWINENEIKNVFSRTDLALLPYTEASQSGVIPTAFAAGMPCVVTPVPGLQEQIKNRKNGLVSKRIDPQALAIELHKILKNRKLYEKLSAGCIKTAKKNLNWDTIAKKTVINIKKAYQKNNFMH